MEEEGSVYIRHEPCPQCQKNGSDRDGNNLARYSDGHGHCFSCGYYEKSGAEQLVESDRPVFSKSSNLLDVVYKPLPARGILQETAQLFSYGIGKYHGLPCHVAQYQDQSGNWVGQHIRLQGKEFRWLGETKNLRLFGQHLWKRGGRRLIITEGELDCLAVSQLQGNKWPVVSLPNGAQAGAKAIKANLEWVSSFKDIILCFDMDEEGRKATKECAALLPIGSVRIVTLPLKDANECLLKGEGQQLITAIWQADEYRPDGIKAGFDLWEDLLTPPQEGYDIPYRELSDKLQGLRKGELYLFTAGSGIGKSTIVNEIAYHLHMEHGLRLGIMALEESPARNARRYLGIYLNKPLHIASVYSTVTQDQMREAFDNVMADGWYIYDHFGSSDIETLLGKLRYMITGLQCDVIVLDHISIIVSGLDEQGSDERKTIDIFMSRLRSLIEETGVMVLAVVHLRRPDSKGKSYNEGRQVSLTDLRGSGSLEQLSDVVVALERDQQADDEKESNTSIIRVLKNRPIGIVGEAGSAIYNPDTGRLLPTTGFEDSEEDEGEDEKDVEF